MRFLYLGVVFLALFFSGCSQPTASPAPSSIPSPSPSAGLTDCGSSMNLVGLPELLTCFYEATVDCGKAKMNMSSASTGGQVVSVYYETKGLEDGLCVVYSVVSGPEENFLSGKDYTCKIDPKRLTEILAEGAQGHFSTENGIPQNSESCTGPLAG